MATVAENKKRGRPNLYEKYDLVERQKFLEFSYSQNAESRRAKNDEFYKTQAFFLLMDSDKEKFQENFVTPKGKIKYISVLIQIGRLYLQDNYDADFCVNMAWSAIENIKNGFTVHQAALKIRNQRLSNFLLS